MFQLTKESIVYRLLDVVSVPALFRQHYETVALSYMQQHNINPEKNLYQYVRVGVYLALSMIG